MRKILLASAGTIVAVLIATAGISFAQNPFYNNPNSTTPRQMHGKYEMMQQLASWLNMSPTDLMLQLQSGKTLASIMSAQGVTRAQVHDRARAYVKTQLDPKVQSGDITQDQENMLLQIFDQMYQRHADEVLSRQFNTNMHMQP
jgi:hypothetical protein